MKLDAIELEVMEHAFRGIAEEMGSVLVASALSPNIRERRDSSAAVFSATGEMIAQAAHIPVHLGAMPEAVKAVRGLEPAPGDTFILNDPYFGGTHLPDITMVHAVELDGGVGAYTVVRAHHSDVGGSTPGSMPPHSTEIFQEGLVIPPVRFASGAERVPDVQRLLLANVRTPEVRSGDLAAQLAACRIGAARYRELAGAHTRERVTAAETELLSYAERMALNLLRERIPSGRFEAVDYLEGDGTADEDIAIRVGVEMHDHGLLVDFAGTDPAVRGNVNCPLSVTRSAVLFVVRCIIGPDVPANGGVYRAIDVRAPRGSVVNAVWPRAVAAGNVETSQRIADTVALALQDVAGLPAQGQGTMNNIIIGGAGWTYYETLGGGQGASREKDGPSGVHVGMSNTRNTPVEVIEMDYPLRIARYSLRDGSGGSGRRRGGDGVVREYVALEDVHVSLITDRRRHAPRGAAGGSPGATGLNRLNDETLPAKTEARLEKGDTLSVATPGGGGFGAPG